MPMKIIKGSNDGLISIAQFKELADVHARNCVSIYIPTSRAGEQVDKGQDQKRLKNQLKDLQARWTEMGFKDNEIQHKIRPLEDLLGNSHFWRNQSDGLALLMQDDNALYIYTLPLAFQPVLLVSDHFYLKPLIPFFNDDGTYYILALSLQEIKLFECSRHFITEIFIEDLTPEKLEDAVGYDFREKNLQYRSGQGGDAGAMYHGHGSGKNDKDQEIEKFFRAVDTGLMRIMKEEKAPLILACVERYHALYSKITKYANVFESFVGGNPEQYDPVLLHEKSWELVKEYFRDQRKQKATRLQHLSAKGSTSYDIGEILPAALDGLIDTLFIQVHADQYGLYDPEERSIIKGTDQRPPNASLFNMAAVHTLKNGGRVFIAEPEEMPFEETDINALFRY